MGSWKCEEIGPDKAKRYLEKMGYNRNRSQSRVCEYAGMMKRGEWLLTHQGIAFDETGKLRDGQHRLLAIIESGCTIRCWVYRGMEENAVVAVDRQQQRTDYQAATIAGTPTSKDDVAILKAMMMSDFANSRIPLDILLMKLAIHRDAIVWTKGEMGKKTKGLTHAVLLGVISRAWYTVDRARLHEFCNVLKTGLCEQDEDVAAIRIRDFLMTSPLTSGGSAARKELYQKIESALVAFLERRPLAKIYGFEKEQFALPE